MPKTKHRDRGKRSLTALEQTAVRMVVCEKRQLSDIARIYALAFGRARAKLGEAIERHCDRCPLFRHCETRDFTPEEVDLDEKLEYGFWLMGMAELEDDVDDPPVEKF